jgi:membrane fusion protein (multidrug efflux system)
MHKEILEKSRVRILLASFAISAAVILLVWWFFFRAYVSTNDARIATTIIRISPVGVGGVIQKVNVAEGDFVKKDQTLVEIDHRAAEAQFIRAQARYQMAKTDYNRAKSLSTNNYNSAKDLDNARTNYQIAEAEQRLADINLQNTYLKSPIDGIVIQKNANEGNVLEPGQVAIILADAANSWVSANIEETNIARIKLGQKVFISVDEGGSLTGTIEEITSATASQFSLLPSENASGNYTKVVQKIPIKIALDPHPGRILKTGQSVSIKIKVQ